MRVAQRLGAEVLAWQLDLLIADAVRPAGFCGQRGQVGSQAETVIGLAQQKRAGVRCDAGIGLSQLDRAVELRFKQPAPVITGPSPAVTHEARLPLRGTCVPTRIFHAAKRPWLAATLRMLANNPGSESPLTSVIPWAQRRGREIAERATHRPRTEPRPGRLAQLPKPKRDTHDQRSYSIIRVSSRTADG